jgi:hypothetical protein
MPCGQVVAHAMLTASITSGARQRRVKHQPKMERSKQSMTAVKYAQPSSPHHTEVRSVCHNTFDVSMLNGRPCALGCLAVPREVVGIGG